HDAAKFCFSPSRPDAEPIPKLIGHVCVFEGRKFANGSDGDHGIERKSVPIRLHPSVLESLGLVRIKTALKRATVHRMVSVSRCFSGGQVLSLAASVVGKSLVSLLQWWASA